MAANVTQAIECVGVVKRFGDIVALDRLDLDVAAGRVVGYVGPNGAGKSTTIRLLLDLSRADDGAVRVLGRDPRDHGADLRRRIGYLPGELRLDDRLRVDETLRFWGRLRGGVDASYVDELCERLSLDPGRRTQGLSTGNRRKVGLVGAFMGRPELLILDEPTAGIDPLVQASFHELVEAAGAAGQTVFLSSHVLSEVQRVADDVLVIRDGRIVARGDVDELRQATSQPFSVWFEGAAPADALRGAAGVEQLEVTGSSATGLVVGSPDALLAVLASHPVRHLLMPEPDLEQAFLRYYSGEEGPS